MYWPLALFIMTNVFHVDHGLGSFDEFEATSDNDHWNANDMDSEAQALAADWWTRSAAFLLLLKRAGTRAVESMGKNASSLVDLQQLHQRRTDLAQRKLFIESTSAIYCHGRWVLQWFGIACLSSIGLSILSRVLFPLCSFLFRVAVISWGSSYERYSETVAWFQYDLQVFPSYEFRLFLIVSCAIVSGILAWADRSNSYRLLVIDQDLARLDSECTQKTLITLSKVLVDVTGYSGLSDLSGYWMAIDGVFGILCAWMPLLALALPTHSRLFNFVRGLYTAITNRARINAWYGKVFEWLDQRSKLCRYAIYGAVLSSVAALCSFYYVKGAKADKRRKQFEEMAKVRKRDQQVGQYWSDFEDIDYNDIPDTNFSPTRAFEASPEFSGIERLHRSLVLVGGPRHQGTGFRCGNHIITALHCLTSFGDRYGAAVWNPVDKRVYFAPLEKIFRAQASCIAKDGIAICSLPNHEYFDSLYSSSVRSLGNGTYTVGNFVLNGTSDNRFWNFASGKATVVDTVMKYNATALPGSSGGPVFHQTGAVMGVCFAESCDSNFAFVFTPEIVDFLTKRGAAPSNTSESVPCNNHSGIKSTETEKRNESSVVQSSPSAGPGPTLGKKKNNNKYYPTTGTGKNATESKCNCPKEAVCNCGKRKNERNKKRDNPSPGPGDGEDYTSSNEEQPEEA